MLPILMPKINYAIFIEIDSGLKKKLYWRVKPQKKLKFLESALFSG